MNRSAIPRSLLVPLIVVLLTALPLLLVVGHEFVLIDDPNNIYDNDYLKNLNAEKLRLFWAEPYNNLYMPLTYTVWAMLVPLAKFDKPIFTGNMGTTPFDPTPYHALNLLLHLGAVALVYTILRRLLARLTQDEEAKDYSLPAAAGALLFGLFPAQVESVAWVTGMNNTLSTFFALLCVRQYLEFAAPLPKEERGKAWRYLLALFWFILALLSKPTVVALPLGILLLDVLYLRRSIGKAFLAMLPYFVYSTGMVFLTQGAQAAGNAKLFWNPVWQRPFIAGDSLAFYFLRVLVPVRFMFDYGLSTTVVMASWISYIAWIVPVAIAGVFVWKAKTEIGRLALCGFLLFLCSTLPTIGLVPFYFQPVSIVADRYLYMAMLGPALLLALLLHKVTGTRVSRPVWIVASVFLLVSAGQTFLQARVWKDSLSIFSDTLTKNNRSYFTWSALGGMSKMHQKNDEAMTYYRQALELKPDYLEPRLQLAYMLLAKGDLQEAEKEYRECLRLWKNHPEAELYLGLLEAQTGRAPQGIKRLELLVIQNPNNLVDRLALARAYALVGNKKAAIAQYKEGLRIDPTSAETKQHLAELGEPTP